MAKWALEGRKRAICELITIVILVCFLFLQALVEAIDHIVALKEPCCEEKLGHAPKLYLLPDAETCSNNSTDGGVVLNATDGGTCCVDVDTCAANDECLSDCVFNALGFGLAQFAPGPAGAFLEAGCFIAAVEALVICGFIGRAVDRKYAPKHEPLTWAGIDKSYCLLFFLIPPFVMFFCATLGANVGVQLVLSVAPLPFLIALAVPVWLLCTPLALGSSVPSFRAIRNIQIEEQKRQVALAVKNAKRLSTPQGLVKSLWSVLRGKGPEAKQRRDQFISSLGAVAMLLLRPSPIRWLTFYKSLAAVLFFSAWPALIGLVWFVVRLFATAVLCIFNPPKFMEEYGYSVRQRERVRLMAYPKFWMSSEVYSRYAKREVGEAQSGSGLSSGDLEAQVGAGKTVAIGRDKACVLVTSELAALLWEGAPMPPFMENLLPVLCGIFVETLSLVFFAVKAAGLAERTLQAHDGKTKKSSLAVGKVFAKGGMPWPPRLRRQHFKRWARPPAGRWMLRATVGPKLQKEPGQTCEEKLAYEEKLALWRKLDGGDLEAVLASGAVALLNARWIIKHANKGHVLKHRQALPEEAFLTLSDLVEATTKYDFPVAALSYPWLTKDHPDPRGANLRRVARALKALLSNPYITRLGVFWDFGSLHQHPDPANGVVRTEDENALFKQGLGCLGTLYSHPHTTVLRLTSFPDGHKKEDQAVGTNVAKYFDRGWCFTESSWASLTKSMHLSLDLGLMRDGKKYDYGSLIIACTEGGGRRPPLLPSAFAAELEAKSFTNGKDDKPLVKRLYQAAFEEQFGKATELGYAELDWGDAEAAQLAEVLASGAAPRLETLNLGKNQIGDAGCKALADALGKEGAAPRLKELLLHYNQIGEEGCKALAAALKQGAAPSLKKLELLSKQPELVAVCEERGIRLLF